VSSERGTFPLMLVLLLGLASFSGASLLLAKRR